MSPRVLFRRVAVLEAFTWTGLLVGMFLKYVTETTEAVVSVFGMAHGAAFIAYGLITLLVAVDQKWTTGRTLLGLASAVPPLATVWFDLRMERAGALSDTWRLRDQAPASAPERLVAVLVRRPLRGLLAGLVGVGVLTAVALVVGPPVGG